MALNLEFNPLPAGSYVGTVSEIRFHHGEMISLIPTVSVTHDGQIHSISDFLPLDAPTGHPRYNETAKGKGLVLNLLGPNPSISDLDDLAQQMQGLNVRVILVTRNRDGFSVPKISSISRAEPLPQQKQEG